MTSCDTTRPYASLPTANAAFPVTMSPPIDLESGPVAALQQHPVSNSVRPRELEVESHTLPLPQPNVESTNAIAAPQADVQQDVSAPAEHFKTKSVMSIEPCVEVFFAEPLGQSVETTSTLPSESNVELNALLPADIMTAEASTAATITPTMLEAAQAEDLQLQRDLNRSPGQFCIREWQGSRIVYRKQPEPARPVLPTALQRTVFDEMHARSHPGAKASVRLITERYTGHRLAQNIRQWVAQCMQCQRHKITRHTHTPFGVYPLPTERMRVIHLDVVHLTNSRGCRYLLTMIDRFTRWPAASPLFSLSAEETALAFYNEWVTVYGAPTTVITDRGRNFTSHIFEAEMRRLGIEVRHTTAYNPKANGMVERMHRDLKAALAATTIDSDWLATYRSILMSFRATYRASLKASPAQLLMATDFRLPNQPPPPPAIDLEPGELANQLRSHFASLTAPAPRGRVIPTYMPPKLATCERVLVRTDAVRSPLQPPYEGPFLVLQRHDKFYVLQQPQGPNAVSIDRLKPAPEAPPPVSATTLPPELLGHDIDDLQPTVALEPLPAQTLMQALNLQPQLSLVPLTDASGQT